MAAPTDKPNTTNNTFLGLFYVCLTSITFQMIAVIVKKVSYISHGQLSLIRNTGVFVGTLPIAVYCQEPIFGKKRDTILIFLKAFCGATGLYMTLVAYRCLPLVDAAIVISTIPVVTIVLARVYLKEACGLIQMIPLVPTVLGVLLSMRVPELMQNKDIVVLESSYFGGLAAAVTGVFLLSSSIVTTRKLTHVHFSIISLYNGFVGMIENAVINAILFPYVPACCGWDLILCVSMGLFGFLNNCAQTLSVKQQPAGLVTLEKYSVDIIFMILFQIAFFSEYPDTYSICGACLVIASLTFIGIETWFRTMRN